MPWSQFPNHLRAHARTARCFWEPPRLPASLLLAVLCPRHSLLWAGGRPATRLDPSGKSLASPQVPGPGPMGAGNTASVRQAPLSCYLLHLFEVIIQLGPFSPSDLLTDQLGNERREESVSLRRGGRGLRHPRWLPRDVNMAANGKTGSQTSSCSKPTHSCKPRAGGSYCRKPTLAAPTRSGCAGSSAAPKRVPHPCGVVQTVQAPSQGRGAHTRTGLLWFSEMPRLTLRELWPPFPTELLPLCEGLSGTKGLHAPGAPLRGEQVLNMRTAMGQAPSGREDLPHTGQLWCPEVTSCVHRCEHTQTHNLLVASSSLCPLVRTAPGAPEDTLTLTLTCVVLGYQLHWASVFTSVKWGDRCALTKLWPGCHGLLCASVCSGVLLRQPCCPH